MIAAVENPLDEERKKIALYLIDKMDLEVIEKDLPKKREDALSYSIRFGEKEIVQKLLDKGVDISFEKRVGEGNSTYLNYIIAVLMEHGNKSIEKTKEIFDLIESEMDEKNIQKHKKDEVFIQQLKVFYPEKWEK